MEIRVIRSTVCRRSILRRTKNYVLPRLLFEGLSRNIYSATTESRKVTIAELLLGAIKKTRFEFPSCVSEGPTEFVFEKNVPVNDFLSYIADILMGLIFSRKN